MEGMTKEQSRKTMAGKATYGKSNKAICTENLSILFYTKQYNIKRLKAKSARNPIINIRVLQGTHSMVCKPFQRRIRKWPPTAHFGKSAWWSHNATGIHREKNLASLLQEYSRKNTNAWDGTEPKDMICDNQGSFEDYKDWPRWEKSIT